MSPVYNPTLLRSLTIREEFLCLMPFDSLTYLIVCPLVFLAGFIDAIAGGGGLISLPAYIISGLPIHTCIGTNKLSSAMGTALTAIRFGRRGYIPWKIAACCIVTALIGGVLGARLTLLVSDYYLKLIMLVVLPVTAAYLMRGKALDAQKESLAPGRTIVLGMLISLFIGVYDGFYGPGTGTFLILLLCGWAHMRIAQANGTAKAINLATNLAGLSVFVASGDITVALGLVAGVFGIAGNYLGARSFDKGAAAIAKPVMLVVLALFFVRVVLELAGVV